MANRNFSPVRFSMYLKRVLLAVLSLYLCSCNYGFKGANPPEGIKTIFIPTIKDQSGFGLSALGETTTELLKSKFIKDNTLGYTDKTAADGQLVCNITSVKDDPLVVSGNEQVSKRKVTIVINVEFQNLKTKKDIWKKDFTNWGDYDSSTGGFSQRDSGVSLAIDRITDDILIEVISNW